MHRTVAIIQARTGSTRLPSKPLASVLGRSLLELMLERVQRARTLDAIVVATTTLERDDAIVRVAHRCGMSVFRGSESDVLGRYVGAAALMGADVVVRLTADCPLLDPAVVDRVVTAHRALSHEAQLVTNAPPLGRTYPDGMDVEVFTRDVLARADALAASTVDREHVTRCLHRPPFRVAVVDLDPPAGEARVTVDDAADLDRVRAIFEQLQPRNPAFGLAEVIAWLDADVQVPAGSPIRSER
jgi:spore coat polysaccharide biosynthesis protein SpsF